MSEDLWISVNGLPLSFIGAWGEPVVTHRWPYGSWELTWSMSLPEQFRHPALVRGADVIAYVGSSRVWRGTLNEPDLDSQQYVASGLARQAENVLALTSAGAATWTPDVAIDQAKAAGFITWGRAALYPISSAAYSTGDAADLLTVAQLLDGAIPALGLQWWVDVDNYARADPDPTTPLWMVTPNAGVLGVADDDYVTDLKGRYLASAGTYASVTSQDRSQNAGIRQRGVDLTKFGVMTTAKAQARLDKMLARGLARTGWTNGIQVAAGQVLTLGGTPTALSMIRAGQMIQLTGLADERGVTLYTNIVLAETVWNVNEETLQMSPVGLAARNLSSVIESMGGVLL